MIREQQVTLTIRYDDSATAGKEPAGAINFGRLLGKPGEFAVVDVDCGAERDVWDVEVTDTFSGEANYSWVRRYVIACNDGDHGSAVIRAAKKAAGWNGMACRRENHGETIALFQRGAAVVMFITPRVDGPLTE